MFSPDGKRVAYIAGTGRYIPPVDKYDMESWESRAIVVDGKRGKPNTWIGAFSFSPDSKRYGYISSHYLGHQCVVIVGIEVECYGEQSKVVGNRSFTVSSLLFSPDSKSYAYAANDGGYLGDRSFIVLNGQKQKLYKSVGYPIFSPDSTKLAYCAETTTVANKNHGRSLVVINGREGKKYNSVSCTDPNPFTFSSDSLHYAYLASEYHSNVEQQKCLLIIDGNEQDICIDPRNVIFKK